MKTLQGTHESDYFYDGESRRVRIKELESGTQTKDETFIWCGSRICQKRSGSTVERNYFEQGFEAGTTDYFYTRDRLGSVSEVIANDGSTLAARVSFDPWGKSKESGPGPLSDFGFTGLYFDRPSGESLAWWRGYDSNLGRWLSKDPIGLDGGDNLYGYVSNNPTNENDQLGLSHDVYCKGAERGVACMERCSQHGIMCSNIPFGVPPGIGKGVLSSCSNIGPFGMGKQCGYDFDSSNTYCVFTSWPVPPLCGPLDSTKPAQPKPNTCNGN